MDRLSSGGGAAQPGGGLRAYYVAVGTADAKLDTLLELLEALRADRQLAVAVACSSRDSLDAVVSALARSGGFNLAVLHADLEPHDMEQQLLQLKALLPQQEQRGPQQQQQPMQMDSTPHQQQQLPAQGPTQHGQGQQLPPQPPLQQPQQPRDCRALALVATDVCLKAVAKDLSPLGLQLLVQYDLPATKELLQRRLAAVFGSSKERSKRSGRLVVIDFVVAGQMAAFRARERMSSVVVQETPVHVPDVFA